MRKNNQKGMSIVEVLGTLAIVTVMSVLIVSFYTKVSTKATFKRTEFLLEDIRGKINSIYIDGNYSTLTLDNLNDELEGQELIKAKHPFGGDVALCGSSDGFNIRLSDLTLEEATKLEALGEGDLEKVSDDVYRIIAYKSNSKAKDYDNTRFCNNF
ncbi:MAG: type II secretion system GspH family protein [Alphaproteobacteria bacterium]|jgi:type II secretory pathway pseudopilin PulG|nr:type II secretion system GspH family protein [Alphaproteobacteria bacterium]